MKLISPMLKHLLYPILSRIGFLKHYAHHGKFCAVTYHGVLPTGYQSIDPMLDGTMVSADTLRMQIRLLKARYNVISPEQFRAWIEHKKELPPRAVLLTCDDGLENTVTDMLPVLKDEGVSCLFFVTTAAADAGIGMLWYEELYLMLLNCDEQAVDLPEINLHIKKNGDIWRSSWGHAVKLLSGLEPCERAAALKGVRDRCGLPNGWASSWLDKTSQTGRFALLSSEHVRKLLDAGMSLGGHTRSHPVLSATPEKALREEIATSRKTLQDTLGVEIWALAYPFGDDSSVGTREITMAENSGYSCAFMNSGGQSRDPVPIYAIPRVHVTSDMGIGEFEAHVSGLHDELRRWLGR